MAGRAETTAGDQAVKCPACNNWIEAGMKKCPVCGEKARRAGDYIAKPKNTGRRRYVPRYVAMKQIRTLEDAVDMAKKMGVSYGVFRAFQYTGHIAHPGGGKF